jgi:hypothetical protein
MRAYCWEQLVLGSSQSREFAMAWWRNSNQAASIDQKQTGKSVRPVHELRLAKTAFEDPNFLTKRLFSTLAQEEKSLALSIVHVLLVGFNANEVRSLTQKLSVVGVASCTSIALLKDAQSTRRTFTHLIVNADAWDSIDEAVCALFCYRQCEDDRVVILTSGKILADDLGRERKAICDVSLRFPVSLNRLVEGIMIASANNREFRSSL